MSKIISYVPDEPKSKTLDELVSEYRINYRSTLKRTATVLTLPLRKTKAAFRDSSSNQVTIQYHSHPSLQE